MRWCDVSDAATAVTRLRAALASPRLHHAWVLSGPTERALPAARAFAAALLCREPRGGEACCECATCLRFAAGTHADLHRIAPEGDGATRLIKIAAVRELARAISLCPLEGGRHLALIEEADRMNIEAQNALLKTLEEPPVSVTLILVAQQAEALLPTIKSRCLRVSVPCRRRESPNQREVCGALAGASHGGVRGLLDLSETWSQDKADLPSRLDAIAAVLRDRAVAAARTNGPRGEQAGAAIAGALHVIAAKRALESYANARLTIDWLLLKLRAEGAI